MLQWIRWVENESCISLGKTYLKLRKEKQNQKETRKTYFVRQRKSEKKKKVGGYEPENEVIFVLLI